jgi:hypothetical protein
VGLIAFPNPTHGHAKGILPFDHRQEVRLNAALKLHGANRYFAEDSQQQKCNLHEPFLDTLMC